jgi:hypothetical protein
MSGMIEHAENYLSLCSCLHVFQLYSPVAPCVESAETLPTKSPIYGTLIGLLNCTNSDFTEQFIKVSAVTIMRPSSRSVSVVVVIRHAAVRL